MSFRDLFEEKYNEWKYANFELYDGKGNEMNEGLEEEIDDLFFDFLRDTSHEIYLAKLLKIIEWIIYLKALHCFLLIRIIQFIV